MFVDSVCLHVFDWFLAHKLNWNIEEWMSEHCHADSSLSGTASTATSGGGTKGEKYKASGAFPGKQQYSIVSFALF